LRQLVVDRSSAKYGSTKEGFPLPIDSNHSDMCKFSGMEDYKYEPVRDNISEMVNKARQQVGSMPLPATNTYSTSPAPSSASAVGTGIIQHPIETQHIADPPPPGHRKDFEIAVICSLRLEAEAVEAMFDKFWEDDNLMYGKAPGDPNAYTTGMIGCHNVVLAHMPGIGKASAASVAANLLSSFNGIKLGLVVGICSGVPNGTDDEKEILLGDVIISTGLVKYDFRKQFPNDFIKRNTLTDNLSGPNREIRSLLAKLAGRRSRMLLMNHTSNYLAALSQKPGFESARYPGADEDRLFEPTYRHKHHDLPTCTICAKCEKKEDEVCEIALYSSCIELKCNENKQVTRDRLIKARRTVAGAKEGFAAAQEVVDAQKPVVHFGLIASGNAVTKSGEDRDKIAAKDKVIAFEMEGAGVWDIFPCVIIKGVCDYADSHKNKKWQGYAAATAAACMKAFLDRVREEGIRSQ
jgi:nucleoside phosphorylase